MIMQGIDNIAGKEVQIGCNAMVMGQQNIILLVKDEKYGEQTIKLFEGLYGLWKSYYTLNVIEEEKFTGNNVARYGDLTTLCIDDGISADTLLKSAREMTLKRILLLGTTERKYNDEVIVEYGVSGFKIYSSHQTKTCLRVYEDPITDGLPNKVQLMGTQKEKAGVIIHSGASVLIADRQGNAFLTRYKNRYVLSIPVWQTGVPSFPAIFHILRNFLFFSDRVGHFSPFPYVSLRIDDLPVSSEQYLKSGGISDESRCSEIKTLCGWSARYGAKLEFMVSSHLLTHEGKLASIDVVVPKSAALLREHFRNGAVNLNSHGRSHVDEERYVATRQVSPLEFANLDEKETREHLQASIDFLKDYFGKTPTGFIPPCWSYREVLTKKVCSMFFSFVIDSSEHARSREDCPLMWRLEEDGLFHLTEIWHLGGNGLQWRDSTTWRPFLECGVPLHMMAHGIYLRDPVPSRWFPKALALTAFALTLPFLLIGYGREVLRMVRGVAGRITWDRLGLLRKILVRLPWFEDASVETLLKKGREIGVEWAFTEGLADHLRSYCGLEVLEYRRGPDMHRVSFHLKHKAQGRFLFHLPEPSLESELDGHPISPGTGGRTLSLANLAAGDHLLTVKVQ